MNKCYDCKFRGTVPGSCHSSCGNKEAKVKGDPHGIKSGWFMCHLILTLLGQKNVTDLKV